jgi:hypothetical protein
MSKIKKLVFQFGDVSMTLTEADVEVVMEKLEASGRKVTSSAFAEACLEHMKSHARISSTRS